jgi:DNA-binding NtrC family response regulator
MIDILLAGKDFTSFPAFIAALDESDMQTRYLESGCRVLAAVAKQSFNLLIVEENLDDMTGLELIKSVITIQPMLNCAVVSSLSPGDFHEASEGLGILMQLPVDLGKKEADQLHDHLKRIKPF